MKMNQWMFSTVMVALMMIFNLQVSLASDAVTTIFQVDNMTCSSCLVHIGEELQKFDGIVDLRPDLQHGLLTMIHKDLDEKGLAAFISLVGYPARVVTSAQAAEIVQKSPEPQKAGGCASGGCNATAESWKELIRRLSGKKL